MVLGVDCAADDAEFSENLKVFLFLENVVNFGVDHFRGQVLNKLIGYEVVHDEFIVSEQFLYHVQDGFGFLDFVAIFVFVLVLLFSWDHAFDQIG